MRGQGEREDERYSKGHGNVNGYGCFPLVSVTNFAWCRQSDGAVARVASMFWFRRVTPRQEAS